MTADSPGHTTPRTPTDLSPDPLADLAADSSCDRPMPSVLEPDAVRHLVVHCSATADAVDIGAREIHAMHLGFGWHGIGYHRVVRRDGRIEAGRPDCWIGAHVYGHNAVSLGVCLIGCDTFTDEQFDALEGVLREWQALCPNALIRGHRDFAYTEKTCPNFDVGAWCAERGLQAPLGEVTVPDLPADDGATATMRTTDGAVEGGGRRRIGRR